jgi:hypothetical protein
MYRTITDFLIRSMEDELEASLNYLRIIAEESGSAFFKFLLFAPMSDHRETVPPEAAAVARIVSTRAEDCGTCVQIGVNTARKNGVARSVVEAALTDEPDELSEPLADVYQFTRAVVRRKESEADRYRARVQQAYGRDGLVDLALASATAQVFPLLKRTLGESEACRLVELRWTAAGEPEPLGRTTAATPSAEPTSSR